MSPILRIPSRIGIYLNILDRDTLCNVKPEPKPVNAEAMSRDNTVDRLNPQLGNNRVEAALATDLHTGNKKSTLFHKMP